MGSARTLAWIATATGAALVVLPFLSWYSASLPGGTVRVSGVGASGELWIVPFMGLAAMLGAAFVLRRGPSIAASLSIAVAGVLAAAWSLRNVARTPVRAVVEQAGGVAVVDAQVTLEPAAPLAAVAGTLAALAGGLLALRVWLAP